jgi:hypothetical protein
MCPLFADRYHRRPNGKMYERIGRVGFAVDRAALLRDFPDVTFQDFESWDKKQGWSALHV